MLFQVFLEIYYCSLHSCSCSLQILTWLNSLLALSLDHLFCMCVVVLLMFNIYFDIDFQWNKLRIVLNLVNAFISKIRRRWEIQRLVDYVNYLDIFHIVH